MISCAVVCFSHSGRTDSQGGHYDHIHGGYHFHHGLPAHQHANGVCLYSPAQPEEAKNEETKMEWWEYAYCIVAVAVFVVWIVFSISECGEFIVALVPGFLMAVYWPITLLIILIAATVIAISDRIKKKK